MTLRHLTEQTCSTCGSGPVREEITGHHCNGEQFESRTFKCGRQIRWVPNYSRMEVVITCPQDPRVLSEQNLRIEHRKAFHNFAMKLGWTKPQLDRLDDFLRNVEYWREL